MADSRPDRDMPKEGEAYVIRIETGDGRRAKAIITYRELASLLEVPVVELVTQKARALAGQLPVRA